MRRLLWLWLCTVVSGCTTTETTVNPTINPRIYDSFTSSSLCQGCPSIGKPAGLVPGERAREDEHPLLVASEDLRRAASGLMFFEGSPAERYFKPMQQALAELQAALGEHYKKMPQVIRPLLELVVKASREVLEDPKMDRAVRACLNAYFDAHLKAFTDDPVLVLTKGCIRADPDGTYETLVATMELVTLNEHHIKARVAELMEKPETEKLIQDALGQTDMRKLQWTLNAAFAKFELGRPRDEGLPPVDHRALALALDKLEAELTRAGKVFRESTLYRTCNGDAPPSPEALQAVLQPRFDLTRRLIETRWARLSSSGPIAYLITQRKLPMLQASEVRSALAPLRLAVVAAPYDHAHYSRETKTITVPNGLAAALCNRPPFAMIENALRNDVRVAQVLRAQAESGTVSFMDLMDGAFGLGGSMALAIAEKMELELLSALDFLMAHELAHALFDERDATPPARERELRADGFAVAIVDRTSETALLKRVAGLGESETDFRPGRNRPAPFEDRSPAERALIETLPGGQALFNVYSGTPLARGNADHPPLRERQRWIHRWIVQPLAPRSAVSIDDATQ